MTESIGYGLQNLSYVLLNHLQKKKVCPLLILWLQDGLEGLLSLFTRVLGLVQGTEPWCTARHAKGILTTYKDIANITFTMRR